MLLEVCLGQVKGIKKWAVLRSFNKQLQSAAHNQAMNQGPEMKSMENRSVLALL